MGASDAQGLIVSPEPLAADIAIRCRDLHKTYLVYKNLVWGLSRKFLFPNRPNHHVQRVEALKGINLEIKKGEVFGFLGPNGAGKSTLLACIAGISPIDKGSIETNGHVEALLQIGVGFHPLFTGRENIVIGLISMGASVDEALNAVEPVLEFAELKDFGDMPFYTFSSGMKARLQFAVAVHRTPEILILDEALSAGDGLFNSKANRRVEEICGGGSTVLLVSHSIWMVESLCQRAAILQKGEVIDEDDATKIGAAYRRMISESSVTSHREYQLHGRPRSADIGTGEVTIVGESIEFPEDRQVAVWDKPLALIVDLIAHEPIENPRLRVDIYDSHDGRLATNILINCIDPATRRRRQIDLGRLEGHFRLRFDIPALPLGGGTYFWSFALIPPTKRRKLEGEDDFYVYRRVMGYFQTESFSASADGYGRRVTTETPVTISVSHRATSGNQLPAEENCQWD